MTKLLYSTLKAITNFEAIGNSLTKAKCYVMALGKNVNGTCFEKAAVDDAFKSLGCIPVVGHLIKDEDGKHHLGGHDYIYDKDNHKFESVCVPFGFVLPSEEPTYEEVEEEDGTTNTYLTCEVILWTGRYPALMEAKYNDKILFGQSMEIFVAESEAVANYTNILKFEFDALCMLNKSDDESLNVEPCFPNASIVTEYSKNSDAFREFFADFKKEFTQFFKEDFVLKDKTKNLEVFAATYESKRTAIVAALTAMGKRTETERKNYYLMDFDDKYVFVNKEVYTHSDDDYSYDNTYWRIGYTFDEGTVTATLGEDAVPVAKYWLTAEERAALDAKIATFEGDNVALVTELSEYQATHSHTDEEYNALAQFKADTIEEQRKASISAVFSKYDSILGESEDYIALKNDCGDASAEEIENSCLRLVGIYSMAHMGADKHEKKLDFGKAPVGGKEEEVPYGGFIERHTSK